MLAKTLTRCHLKVFNRIFIDHSTRLWTYRLLTLSKMATSRSYASASAGSTASIAATSSSSPAQPGAKTVVCLFRNDLRYHDNEALQWANR